MTRCSPLLASLNNDTHSSNLPWSVFLCSLELSVPFCLWNCRRTADSHVEHTFCTTKLLDFLKHSFNEKDHLLTEKSHLCKKVVTLWNTYFLGRNLKWFLYCDCFHFTLRVCLCLKMLHFECVCLKSWCVLRTAPTGGESVEVLDRKAAPTSPCSLVRPFGVSSGRKYSLVLASKWCLVWSSHSKVTWGRVRRGGFRTHTWLLAESERVKHFATSNSLFTLTLFIQCDEMKKHYSCGLCVMWPTSATHTGSCGPQRMK